MVVLIALIGAAIVGLLLWKAMNLTRERRSVDPPARSPTGQRPRR